jgi:hypothetical protein
MGKALDHAKVVARALGMTHKEFAQADIVDNFAEEHRQGVCSGLSLMYQAYHNGIFSTDFFAELTPDAFQKPSVINYISLAQNWQKRGEASTAGKREAMNRIMSMFGFKYIDHAEFDGYGRGYAAFTAFIGRSDHYSMVSIPGHAMAAVGKTFGVKFFDPNFGEVSCKTERTMGQFCERFFSGDSVKKFYLRDSHFNKNSWGERASLRVIRYKLHG